MSATPPALKAGYTVRPCTMDDVEAVVALMNACSMKVIGQEDETVEEIRTSWLRPNFDQAVNQRVVLSPDNRLAGWAEVWDGEVVIIEIDIYVHPDYETEGVGEYLLHWAESRAREQVANAPDGERVAMRAYSMAAELDQYYTGLLMSGGMRLIRHFWHMEITLSTPPPVPEFPPGITLKRYQLGEDKQPIFDVRREAFRDQFGHTERPYDEHYAEWLHYWESDGVLVPELWLLAMDGDAIAGIALCKAEHNGEADRGWVSSLGVKREYRRRGIGEALLHAAFNTFANMGKARVGLGVDASSLTGAATLYKRAGMHVVKQFDLYEKEMRAGKDTTTHG